MTVRPIASSPVNDDAWEAACILAGLLDHLHIVGARRGVVQITADLPADLLDRLAAWGTEAEDFENDGDTEFDPAEHDRNEVAPEGGWSPS